MRKTKLKLRGKKEKKVVCARLKLSYGRKSGFAAKNSLGKTTLKLRGKEKKKVVCARLKSSYGPSINHKMNAMYGVMKMRQARRFCKQNRIFTAQAHETRF